LYSPERLVLDPNWHPFAYDAKADSLSFAHLPRAIQRQKVFLDDRYVQDAPMVGPVPARSLPRDALRAQAGPIHFIFHTAFCCSTLLARALDIPGAAMGLKEPAILGDFAAAASAKPNSLDVTTSLGTALDLLSRPLEAGEVQVVKASNLANGIVPQILDLRPDARAIIMHSTLENYLRSTAQKSIIGRVFNREALRLLHPVMPLSRDLTTDVLLRLTDLEVAALVWLMQMRFLNDVAVRYGPSRVRTLRGKTLLQRPAETMARVGGFFGIDLREETTWDAVASGPVFQEHAKSFGRPFNAEARMAELKAAGEQHAIEIESVLTWAEGIAAKTAAPQMLGDTLINTKPSRPEPASRLGTCAQPGPQAPHHS
jgi:hypothetical protein